MSVLAPACAQCAPGRALGNDTVCGSGSAAPRALLRMASHNDQHGSLLTCSFGTSEYLLLIAALLTCAGLEQALFQHGSITLKRKTSYGARARKAKAANIAVMAGARKINRVEEKRQRHQRRYQQ